jgi:hypothetical protein
VTDLQVLALASFMMSAANYTRHGAELMFMVWAGVGLLYVYLNRRISSQHGQSK